MIDSKGALCVLPNQISFRDLENARESPASQAGLDHRLAQVSKINNNRIRFN